MSIDEVRAVYQILVAKKDERIQGSARDELVKNELTNKAAKIQVYRWLKDYLLAGGNSLWPIGLFKQG